MRDKMKPTLLSWLFVSLVTVTLTLLAVEGALTYTMLDPAPFEGGLFFYSEGNVFENKDWGGFVYEPNSKINNQAYYITDWKIPPVLVKEYDYDIITNSSGLVQQADLDPTRPGILFLGDSFTQGEGATPWFYELEKTWPKNAAEQIINGGITGTGIEAWAGLYKEISSTLKIDKVVFIFSYYDFVRPIWQFTNDDFVCLKDSAQCDSQKWGLPYGLPRDPLEAKQKVDKTAQERVAYFLSHGDYLVSHASDLETVLRGTAIYRKLLRPAYHAFTDKMQIEKSKRIILDMVKRLGRDNVMLIELPGREEIVNGRASRVPIDFIKQNGLLYVDGFEACGLAVSDYLVHDSHPNDIGYGKVAKCVDRAVKEAYHPQSGLPTANDASKRAQSYSRKF